MSYIVKIIESAKEKPKLAAFIVITIITGAVCGVLKMFGVNVFNPFNFRF